MVPRLRARQGRRSQQHRHHVRQQLLRAPPEQRFQMVNNAIPSPDMGQLIAQHKIAEVDNAKNKLAQSWQVAERVQDHVNGPHRDSGYLPYRTTELPRAKAVPYGAIHAKDIPPVRASPLGPPAHVMPKLLKGDIMHGQKDEPQPMTGDDYKDLLQERVPDYDDDLGAYEGGASGTLEDPVIIPDPPVQAAPIQDPSAAPKMDLTRPGHINDPVVIPDDPQPIMPQHVTPGAGDELLPPNPPQKEHWIDEKRDIPHAGQEYYDPPERPKHDPDIGESRPADDPVIDVTFGDEGPRKVQQGLDIGDEKESPKQIQQEANQLLDYGEQKAMELEPHVPQIPPGPPIRAPRPGEIGGRKLPRLPPAGIGGVPKQVPYGMPPIETGAGQQMIPRGQEYAPPHSRHLLPTAQTAQNRQPTTFTQDFLHDLQKDDHKRKPDDKDPFKKDFDLSTVSSRDTLFPNPRRRIPPAWRHTESEDEKETVRRPHVSEKKPFKLPFDLSTSTESDDLFKVRKRRPLPRDWRDLGDEKKHQESEDEKSSQDLFKVHKMRPLPRNWRDLGDEKGDPKPPKKKKPFKLPFDLSTSTESSDLFKVRKRRPLPRNWRDLGDRKEDFHSFDTTIYPETTIYTDPTLPPPNPLPPVPYPETTRYTDPTLPPKPKTHTTTGIGDEKEQEWRSLKYKDSSTLKDLPSLPGPRSLKYKDSKTLKDLPSLPGSKLPGSLPGLPPSLKPSHKTRYYAQLRRLGFKMPAAPAAPVQSSAPIIVQGSGGGGSSSAGGSGAGGAAGGSGGGRQADPRQGLALRTALQALKETRQRNTKKRLNTQSRKQITAKRREYTAIRKQKVKAISERQKAELKTVTQQLKGLPKKDRTSRGKVLRAAIRAKYKKIKDKIPTSSKKSMGELVNLIKTAKVLRV